MARVVFLWHMHQPSYRDPIDGTTVLPWVRLHALKDYLGMVELVSEYPNVHVTFNIVPSLIDQIEAYVRREAHEPLQDLCLKPAAELSGDERVVALRGLFMAHEQNLIGRFPRFAELLGQRGRLRDETALRAAATRFSNQDLLDLQVLAKLAWFDPSWLEHDLTLRQLVVKGRTFSEDDKARLAARESALLAAVLPAYRRAAARGQVELSTSPYYHPILPLLCDSEAHHEGSPGAPLPRRFRHPEDAADQIRRAIARHTTAFGAPPAGMWPSEGSVSEEAVRLMIEAGLRWAASDEGILERSVNRPIHRDSRGTAHPPDLLYRAWARRMPEGELRMLFRDRALSDLIGFSYSSLDPETAAHDLLERLRRIDEAWTRQGLPQEAVVPIVLDGENAWEYFRDGGRVFLRTLYKGLSEDPSLTAVTASEAVANDADPGVLPRVYAGSWIHASFSVWIGHADDRRAWDLLGEARDALAAAPASVPAESLQRAWEIYRAACGSDWTWWYGEEHASDNDLEFDLLYRRHLRAIFGLLGVAAPEALGEPLISTRRLEVRHSRPSGAVTPTLDGRFTTPGEWVTAGVYRASAVGGAMRRGAEGLRAIRFGVGGEMLHVLIEPSAALSEMLSGGEIHLSFPGPTLWRYRITARAGQASIDRAERTSLGWVASSTRAAVAAASVLECSLPLAELRPGAGHEVAFRVLIFEQGIETERHPDAAPIRLQPEEVTRDG